MPKRPARVVDTNVPVAANGQADHATARCEKACRRRLLEFTRGQARLAIDDGNAIFKEYMARLSPGGQGVGDAFLMWVHERQYTPRWCERVRIEPHPSRGYEPFPDDPELEDFDPADRKFVAVARASRSETRVLNALDSDWWDYELILARHKVGVDFVCEDQVRAWRRSRPRNG